VRRILIYGGLLLLVVVLAGATVIGSAFLGRQRITDGFEINGIRIVQDGFVSVAVVPMGQGEVALVDAGNDRSGEAIRAELSRRGLGPEAVKAVLLTHGHRDHIAGIAAFPQAQVMALAAEIPLAEGRARASGPVTRFFPARPTGVKVTLPLQPGDGVMLGDAMVRAYAIPGHTAGSAAYLVNGVLFLGDSADATTDGGIRGSVWAFSDDAAQNRASLVRLHRQLTEDGAEVQAIAFAHSGVLVKGLAPLAAFAARNP
jgi:glyoxylase-like metal-dependent hydrolase (beta-lactamase superfamily II)